MITKQFANGCHNTGIAKKKPMSGWQLRRRLSIPNPKRDEERNEDVRVLSLMPEPNHQQINMYTNSHFLSYFLFLLNLSLFLFYLSLFQTQNTHTTPKTHTHTHIQTPKNKYTHIYTHIYLNTYIHHHNTALRKFEARLRVLTHPIWNSQYVGVRIAWIRVRSFRQYICVCVLHSRLRLVE